MTNVLRAVTIALTSVWLVACAPEEPRERVGNTDDAVNGGTVNDGGPNACANGVGCYPEVVYLFIQIDDPTSTDRCTGILISPRVVLTAHHCFSSAVGHTTGNVTVAFGADPTNPQAITLPHTLANSGEVLLRDPDLDTNQLIFEEVGEDIAVFILDNPVPPSVAMPRHPSLVAGVCPDHFDGVVVGYGNNNLTVDPADTCHQSDTFRRFNDIKGWNRETTSTGFVYSEDETFLVADPCHYDGTNEGDSGGPLIDDVTHNICGVTSGYVPLNMIFGPFPIPGWNVIDREAGVDSQQTIDFFNTAKVTQGVLAGAGPIDPHGNWLGECPEFNKGCINWAVEQGRCGYGDADGDGVFDQCDSCPTIYNPDQLTHNDDPDGNGWGEACDFCPGVDYSFGGRNLSTAGNGNYEIELAEAYPGQTQPFAANGGILGESADPIEKSYYVGAFHPNECDPVAIPGQSLASEDATGSAGLPSIHTCLTPQPGCNCVFSPLSGFCAYDGVNNGIQLWPTTPASTPAQFDKLGEHLPPGASVTLGMRFCPCAGDTSSIEARVKCQANCAFSAGAFGDPKSGWVSIQTETPDLGQDAYIAGLSLLGPAPLNPPSFLWDFAELPKNLLTTTYFNPNPAPGQLPDSVSASGILMAKVVAVDSTPVGPGQHQYPSFFERAMTFQSADVSATLVGTGGLMQPTLGQFPVPIWEMVDDVGPDPNRLLAKAPNDDRMWLITSTGVVQAKNIQPSLAALADQFLKGSLLNVPASEMPALLARKTPVKSPLLRGVAFETAHPQVANVVESQNVNQPPALQSRPPCGAFCSPVLHGNEGIMLAGSLRRLLVIGGTSDGTDTGTPNSSAWLLDVDENKWKELGLVNQPHPGAVRSAVYRATDMEAYFVESKPEKLRLWRYLPRGELKDLMTLPEDWKNYPIEYLAAGEGGDLILAASEQPTGNEDHVLVCHHLKNGNLETRAVHPHDVAALLNPKPCAKNGDGNNDDNGDDNNGDGNDHGDDNGKKQQCEQDNDGGAYTLGPCANEIGDDPGPHLSLLARFQIDAAGKITFIGEKHLVTPILGRPIVTRTTILAPVPMGKLARLRHVALNELVPEGEAPEDD